MTTTRGRRTPPANTPTVAVTGAAGPVGAALTAALLAEPEVGRVVAIDERRGPAPGVHWRTADVRDPGVLRRLSGVDTVVHCAVDLSPEAEPRARSELHVTGTRTVVTAAAAAGVRRVVLLTSAMVYGAFPDNPVPLAEDAPLRAPAEGLLGDLREIEDVAVAARTTHPGLTVTVVRPAALVGPGIDTTVTRHFAAPRLLTVKDAPMCWQFCHLDDLVSALAVAAIGRVSGAVTVGSPGWLTTQEVERETGLRRVELPASIAFGTAERLHRAGIVPTPASELAFVAYPWAVPSSRLLEAGWSPAYDNVAVLRALMDVLAARRQAAGRRRGLREAGIASAGAAGATVAVLGAAAFVRRARRIRGL